MVVNSGTGPLRVERRGRALFAAIDRPDAGNAIDGALLDALDAALDDAEGDAAVRAFVLAGRPGLFCTGMDLAALTGAENVGAASLQAGARGYFRLLRRLATSRCATVALVDGRCDAGGIGLIAAADVVLCAPQSTFRLPEALLGLIPANVMPFLIRRVGFHRAFRLSATADTLDATAALAAGLVDEIGDPLDAALRRTLLRLERVPDGTLGALKRYMNALTPIDEAAEELAVREIAAMLEDPRSLERVRELMRHGVWQGAPR